MPKKTRNGGQWTESRFNSFIKSALRTASVRWPPRYETLAAAYVDRMVNPATGRLAKFYKCNRCENLFVQKEVEVNHKIPVVPTSGFSSWDETVERMFCEAEGLEVVCVPCHKGITKLENAERKKEKNVASE